MNKEQFKSRYGPWAVVTGASSGIGRELAKRAAERGLNIILVARDRTALSVLAASLRNDHKIEVQTLSADLATDEGNASLFNVASEREVGLLVAAAGFGTSGEFVRSDIATETDMLRVNCLAVIQQVRRFAEPMATRKRGGIVLLSSLVGFQGTPFSANYAATKAYIQSFAEALHVELKPYGVDVLSVAPGPVNSGFAKRAGMQMGAADTPENVARNVLNALPQRATIRPGLLGKFLAWSLATTPRWVAVRIMAKIMRGLTKT
jgi:uncharacterized protein